MGKSKWKTICAALILSASVAAAAGDVQASVKDEKWANAAAKIARANGTEQVKTIQWGAKVTGTVKTKVRSNKKNSNDKKIGKKITVSAGTSVTVIQRDYHEDTGSSQCQLKNGRVVYISNKYLDFQTAICTGAKKDYSRKTKLAYINGQNISSGDKYLLWISLDKQRVNVFKGKNHHWKLIHVWKCSSGIVSAPTRDQSYRSNYRIDWKQRKRDYMSWYCAFQGSGFHNLGSSSVAGIRPASYGCCRLFESKAIWVYKNTTSAEEAGSRAKATRVWIW